MKRRAYAPTEVTVGEYRFQVQATGDVYFRTAQGPLLKVTNDDLKQKVILLASER